MSEKTTEDCIGVDCWRDLFSPTLDKDPGRAERVAKLFHYLLIEIENNPRGSVHALACLENALRLAFSFTPMYRTCLILFQASLDEDFPPNLDSIGQVAEAARRVKAELQRASRSRPKKRA